MAAFLKWLWPFRNEDANGTGTGNGNGNNKDNSHANGGVVDAAVATRLEPQPSTAHSSSDKTKASSNPVIKALDKVRHTFRDLRTVVDVAVASIRGSPIDDKTYLMERIIQLTTDLPYQSIGSETATKLFLKELWDDLQHPAQTSLGSKFAARQADGSYNSLFFPNVGAAGQPYARTVRPRQEQPASLPDPGLIFDSLLARKAFTPHPNQISSVLFYVATLIIHDIFKTDHTDFSITNTTSYLDLAPLYGSNLEDQMLVRTRRDGKLKADCFSDKRILGFPPGVGVLLIFYNRFHNSVVGKLAQIDENGRFSSILSRAQRSSGSTNAEKEYDEALFQTGRLVTTGLYINMILKDYVRTILNLNSVDTKWSLDPRSEESKALIKTKIPEGLGNQVSAEFNLIYRWHSTISQRDQAWTENEFKQLLGGKDPASVSVRELLLELRKFMDALPADPQERPFHNIQRQPDGTLPDDQLASIWTDSVDDVAGAFAAQHVPQVMRSVEILSIIQGRTWNLASLNEFREYFNLARHKTFEDINSDPYIQEQLRNLYGHPDHVELYPGVLVEDAKKPVSPGSGLCTNFTISRAILSDAVSLVRSDRFYTLDYTPRNLTNWGYTAAEYDTSIDYGCVMQKVVRNALPNHFEAYSVYAHYPLSTSAKDQELLKNLGQEHYYDFTKPRLGGRPARTVVVQGDGDISLTTGLWSRRVTGLGGPQLQSSPEQPPLNAAFFGSLAKNEQWKATLSSFFLGKMRRLWHQRQYRISVFDQINIIRDVVNQAYVDFLIQVAGLSDGDLSGLELQDILAVLFDFGFTAAPVTIPNGAQRKQVQKLAQLITGKISHSRSGDVGKLGRDVDERVEADADKYLETQGKRAWAEVTSSHSGKDATYLAWDQVLAEFTLTIAIASRLTAQLIDKILSGGPTEIAAAQGIGAQAAQAAQGQSTGLEALISKVTTESAEVTIVDQGSEEERLVYIITGARLMTVTTGVVKIAADLHSASAAALLQLIAPLSNFERVAGPLGQLKQVQVTAATAATGESPGILYLGERQNSMSNIPTTLKVQWRT